LVFTFQVASWVPVAAHYQLVVGTVVPVLVQLTTVELTRPFES
jgi:hypothetical protein